ncbi:hypothetical protein [Aestuariivivens sediminicola]|uniref:hypothetical protein n=1 Tax=Aestuariivivens sediminicola TaxID=2913560 RepID=UPI001F563027|nr:hypothetical protein [Aestuariivivens sediminicola]
MKIFLILSLFAMGLNAFSQNECDEANSYFVIAYSHVKEAYDSNNISHLKYFADRSLKSFKLAKKAMGNCNCVKALILANKSIDLLAKVDTAETYEDGRFFVKRARNISRECVIEIDKCSVASTTLISETNNTGTLSDLEKEQLKLRQQQDALKRKEAELKAKLAEQQEKSLLLKKKELIHSYESAISSTIKTYNETLHICSCNHDTLKAEVATEDELETQSLEAIISYFNQTIKGLASNYMAELDSCSPN